MALSTLASRLSVRNSKSKIAAQMISTTASTTGSLFSDSIGRSIPRGGCSATACAAAGSRTAMVVSDCNRVIG